MGIFLRQTHHVPAAELDHNDIGRGAFLENAFEGYRKVAGIGSDEYGCTVFVREPPDKLISGYLPYNEPVLVVGKEEDSTCE